MDNAESIAKSCNLINEDIHLFHLCGNPNSGFDDAITSISDFQLRFREFKGRFNSMEQTGKFAILIDEKILDKILAKDKNSNIEEQGFRKKF